MNQINFYELELIVGYQAPGQGTARRPQEWLLWDRSKHKPRIVGRTRSKRRPSVLLPR